MTPEGISPLYRSLYGALQAVMDDLHPGLVPADTRQRLLAFAERHPELGQTQYLECRLAQEGPAQVDLLVSAATTFERAFLSSGLAAWTAGPPTFWPILRFVEAWASPTSPLHQVVPVAWLEFDHMDRDADPVANVGVCLAPAYLDPFAPLPRQPASDMLVTVLETLRVIRRHAASSDELACFQRCLGRLPDGARWIHLSVMAARSPLELKLYGAFPRDTVLPYLTQVGWAGDRAAVADLLAIYCSDARTAGMVYLDLPVTGLQAPETAGLGVVFSQQQLRTAVDNDPGRRALLDQMVIRGLCTPGEREALARWPGHRERGPDGFRLDRWLDIKLAHRPGQPLLGKAYLGFAGRNLSGSALRSAAPDSRRKEAYPAPDVAPGTI
jgi:hypothetical protein